MPTKLPFIIQSGVRTRGEARVTGLTGVLCAAARYDFAEHGGAIGTINLGVTVPAGAILLMYSWDLIESFEGDSLTLGGFTLVDEDTEQLTEMKAIWRDPEDPDPPARHGWDLDLPQMHFATSMPGIGRFKITEDREVKFLIQGGTITQGVIDYYVMFLMPQA